MAFLGWPESGGVSLKPQPGEKQAHVHDAAAEFIGARFVGPCREEMSEWYSCIADPQSGGVSHDGVHIRGKSRQVAPGKRDARRHAGRQCARRDRRSTLERAQDKHFHAIASEHLDGRDIDVRIEHLLGATSEQGDARPACSASPRETWRVLGRRKRSRDEVEHWAQRARHERPKHFAKPPDESGEPEALGKGNRLRGEKAPQLFGEAAGKMSLRERAEWTDEVPVGHAARAGGLAGQALRGSDPRAAGAFSQGSEPSRTPPS